MAGGAKNYYSRSGNNYCMRGAEFLSENNYFHGVDEFYDYHDSTDSVFNPSYTYHARSASGARTAVIYGAGNDSGTRGITGVRLLINWGGYMQQWSFVKP